MNRRDFLRVCVALPVAAALPRMVELAPAEATESRGPTLYFVTSDGDMAFATTPDMWELFCDGMMKLRGPLTWTAQRTMFVTAVDVDPHDGRGRRRVGNLYGGITHLLTGDSANVHVTLAG